MDKRALKILLDTFWSPSGWDRREPSADDFSYAKSKRLMFDPCIARHDETIARLRATAERLSPKVVADGFLASLSSRRLDWRSALGSYSVARWMPVHKATPGERQCRVCGIYAGEREEDLNVLNFERFKWGGVRHSDPVYALLDLELFLEDPPPAPTADDCRVFGDMIAAIYAAAPSVTSAALQSHLAGVFKSNKSERDQVVAILGLCGILATKEHPGFADFFVPYRHRKLPDRHFVDMAYPACWWNGSAGFDQAKLETLFDHALR